MGSESSVQQKFHVAELAEYVALFFCPNTNIWVPDWLLYIAKLDVIVVRHARYPSGRHTHSDCYHLVQLPLLGTRLLLYLHSTYETHAV